MSSVCDSKARIFLLCLKFKWQHVDFSLPYLATDTEKSVSLYYYYILSVSIYFNLDKGGGVERESLDLIRPTTLKRILFF